MSTSHPSTDDTSQIVYGRELKFHGTDNAYILPNDPFEQSRLDKQHRAAKALIGGQTITAPVRDPDLILDIGCGTGAVTRELSILFPRAAHIYGVDISPVPVLPSDEAKHPNMRFIQTEAQKLLQGSDPKIPMGSVDFVFNRFLLYAITDWPSYASSVFQMLKPGSYAEMHDIEDNFWYDYPSEPMAPTPVPSSIPERSDQWHWLSLYRYGATAKGLDLDAGPNIATYMRNAGFVDVKSTRYYMPLYHAYPTHPVVGGNECADHCVGDPHGMFWHAIPKMLEGLDLGDQRDKVIKEMRSEMLECVKEEQGKHNAFWVTTGRKPDIP